MPLTAKRQFFTALSLTQHARAVHTETCFYSPLSTWAVADMSLPFRSSSEEMGRIRTTTLTVSSGFDMMSEGRGKDTYLTAILCFALLLFWSDFNQFRLSIAAVLMLPRKAHQWGRGTAEYWRRTAESLSRFLKCSSLFRRTGFIYFYQKKKLSEQKKLP